MTQLNNATNKENKLTSLRPFVDVYESNEGVVLMADLPGVDSEKLKIQVEGTVLSLEGRAVHANTDGAKKELEMIPEGIYRRSFNLSENLDFKRIDAELKSGLLTIKVPKKAAEEPQTINVRAA